MTDQQNILKPQIVKIKGRNGGTLHPIQKGEVRNKKGRQPVPRKLKDFIKQMETEEDEIIIPVSKVEFFTKDGQEFARFKGFKAGKLFASLLQQSTKGNMKALDILIKLGFAGGYEPIKSDSISEIIIKQNKVPEEILRKIQNIK